MLLSIRKRATLCARPAAINSSRSGSAGLLVLHLGELGVDDVALVLLAGVPRGGALLLLTARLRLGLSFGVHLFAQLLRRLRERLRLGVDRRLVFGLERAFGVLQRGLDFLLFARLQLVAVILERLADRVYQRLQLVARVDELQHLAVFLGMRLGVLHHALDLGLGEARACLDLDPVLLAGRLVLGRDVKNAVRVAVEG